MLPSRASRRPLFNRRMIAETGEIPLGYRMIRDTFSFSPLDTKNVVVEGRNGQEEPVMIVTGLFQMGDRKNANGRYYPTRTVLQPAVEQIQEEISSRAVLGEFDHPSDAKIHLDRVSHLITSIWMEGNKVYGKAEVLHKQPCGACLRGLFEHKVRVGISSRGVGDMEMREHNGEETSVVQEGFSFVTWDAVCEPSVDGAILNIQENLNRRLRPVARSKGKFNKATYNSMIVKEINDFFGLK